LNALDYKGLSKKPFRDIVEAFSEEKTMEELVEVKNMVSDIEQLQKLLLTFNRKEF